MALLLPAVFWVNRGKIYLPLSFYHNHPGKCWWKVKRWIFHLILPLVFQICSLKMSFYHFAEGSRDFDFHLDVSASLVLWLGKVFVVRIFPCSWQIFFYSDNSKLLQNRQPVVKIEVGNLLFPEQAEYIYIVVCQRDQKTFQPYLLARNNTMQFAQFLRN